MKHLKKNNRPYQLTNHMSGRDMNFLGLKNYLPWLTLTVNETKKQKGKLMPVLALLVRLGQGFI